MVGWGGEGGGVVFWDGAGGDEGDVDSVGFVA